MANSLWWMHTTSRPACLRATISRVSQPSDIPCFNKHYIRSFDGDQTIPPFLIPVRPPHFDVRISSQWSCFTFQVPGAHAIDTALNPSLRVYRVPMGAKAAIVKELRL